MNGRTESNEGDSRDQELLAAVEQALQAPGSTDPDPATLVGMISWIADAVPEPDAPFRDRLQARVQAELAQQADLHGRRRGRQRRSRRMLVSLISLISLIAVGSIVLLQVLPETLPHPLPTAPLPTGLPISPTEPPATPRATAVPTLPPSPVPTPIGMAYPLRQPAMNVGVVTQLYYTDRDRVLSLTTIAGFQWVRQQVVWKDVEGPYPGNYIWDELDNVVNDVAEHQLKLLVTVVRAPTFYSTSNGLPADPRPMGMFVAAMAHRYGDKIAAYEIWNEQNLAVENGGSISLQDAGTYVEQLAECYRRIKAITPRAYVLAGAPSSTGINDPHVAVADMAYYQAMYSYNHGMIKSYFDAQAAHPGGAANPPDTLWPDRPGSAPGWTTDRTFYFRHVEDVRKRMLEAGLGDHQIWITEFGWATKNTTPDYEYGNLTSFDQQASYIHAAIQLAASSYRDSAGHPWVGAMFLWNMNFSVVNAARGNPGDEQGSFSLLNPDYTPRQAFYDLQGYLPRLTATP